MAGLFREDGNGQFVPVSEQTAFDPVSPGTAVDITRIADSLETLVGKIEAITELEKRNEELLKELDILQMAHDETVGNYESISERLAGATANYHNAINLLKEIERLVDIVPNPQTNGYTTFRGLLGSVKLRILNSGLLVQVQPPVNTFAKED